MIRRILECPDRNFRERSTSAGWITPDIVRLAGELFDTTPQIPASSSPRMCGVQIAFGRISAGP